MKLNPDLLKHMIIASVIITSLIMFVVSVTLRRHKRYLLKLKQTERKLRNISRDACHATTLEEIEKINSKLDWVSQIGTFDSELNSFHLRIKSFTKGKNDLLQKQKNG